MALIFTENQMRKVIREEFERLMSPPENPDVYSIKSVAGGEIIMPNPTKEKFDEGKINSIDDILNG